MKKWGLLAFVLLFKPCAPTLLQYCGSDSVDKHAKIMAACGVGDTAQFKRLLIDHHNEQQQQQLQQDEGGGQGTCTAHDGPTFLMAAAHAGAVDIARILLGVEQLVVGGDGDGTLLLNFDVNAVDAKISVGSQYAHANARTGWQATNFKRALADELFSLPVYICGRRRGRGLLGGG